MEYDYSFPRNCFLFLALVLAVKKIPFINFHFKYIIYTFYLSFWATVLIPVFALKPRDVMNLHIGAIFMKYSAQLTGLSYKLENLEKINGNKSMVVVANHQSVLDYIGMYNMWSSFGKLSVIAKIEILFTSGPIGFYSWLGGVIFINRKKGKKSAELINSALVEMKSNGTKMWVFPEGTRHITGEIHEFKKGAFMAAIHAQVPILPVVFSSYKPFLDTKNKVFNSGEITISVMDEIQTKGLTTADADDLLAKTHQMMSLKFKEISNLL